MRRYRNIFIIIFCCLLVSCAFQMEQSPISLLGKTLEDKDVINFVSNHEKPFLKDGDFPLFYYYSIIDGIEMIVENNKITNIFLKSEGFEDYKQYAGLITKNISMNSNKVEVKNEFGEPTIINEDEITIYGIKISESETYDLGDYLINFSYYSDGKIEQATIFLPVDEKEIIQRVNTYVYLNTEELNRITPGFDEFYSEDDDPIEDGYTWVLHDQMREYILWIKIDYFESSEVAREVYERTNSFFIEKYNYEIREYPGLKGNDGLNPKIEYQVMGNLFNDSSDNELVMNSYKDNIGVLVDFRFVTKIPIMQFLQEIDFEEICISQWNKILTGDM